MHSPVKKEEEKKKCNLELSEGSEGGGGTSGQSYKQFTIIIYDSRVVIWGIFQSGMTLES